MCKNVKIYIYVKIYIKNKKFLKKFDSSPLMLELSKYEMLCVAFFTVQCCI